MAEAHNVVIIDDDDDDFVKKVLRMAGSPTKTATGSPNVVIFIENDDSDFVEEVPQRKKVRVSPPGEHGIVDKAKSVPTFCRCLRKTKSSRGHTHCQAIRGTSANGSMYWRCSKKKSEDPSYCGFFKPM